MIAEIFHPQLVPLYVGVLGQTYQVFKDKNKEWFFVGLLVAMVIGVVYFTTHNSIETNNSNK